MGLIYPVTRSYNHPHIPKKCYETLEQQWMSLLIAHPHTSDAVRLEEI